MKSIKKSKSIVEIKCINCQTVKKSYLYSNQTIYCEICNTKLAKNTGGKIKVEE
jgi:ribosomal protein S27E